MTPHKLWEAAMALLANTLADAVPWGPELDPVLGQEALAIAFARMVHMVGPAVHASAMEAPAPVPLHRSSQERGIRLWVPTRSQ